MPAAFYGMIANLDENLGKLEAFLENKGLKEKTILIYMSDNGTQSTAASQIYNAGTRAKKTSVCEGGHRVPLFIRWPNGKLKHGTETGELTQVQDLLPTLINLCELRNKDSKFDGQSLAGLLKGTKTQLPDRKLVIQYRDSGNPWNPAVVLWKKWRLLKEKKGRKPQKKNAPLELYHVGRDPGQKRNIATKFPKIVETMKEHYEEWHTEARQLFNRKRWITIGSKQANPMVLYAQDRVGDYCDNPRGLTTATATGYCNVIVDRPGTYEIELRRWPKESNKTLTEPWDDSPAKKQSAIAFASMDIANDGMLKDVKPTDTHATFRLDLPTGKTQLLTHFIDKDGQALGSAIYVYVRGIEKTAALTR